MITVYTCSTNQRDGLREDQCTESANFVAFVDSPPSTKSVWEHRSAASVFKSARRNARMHKILSHQYIDSDTSIWMDANVSLRIPAASLAERYLRSADVAVFMHRTRTCTYEEVTRCLELGLDSEEVILEQSKRLSESKFPKNIGLAETTVLLRKHSKQVRNFNNFWWGELCRHSVRDQLSFMYAAHETGTKVEFIQPTKYLHAAFSITNRPAGVESP